MAARSGIAPSATADSGCTAAARDARAIADSVRLKGSELHMNLAALRRVWPQLRRAWPAVGCIGGVALSGLAGWLLAWLLGGSLADGIRYAGTGLQVCGLGLIATGLRDLRHSFGRPSLWAEIRVWCRDVVQSLKPPHHQTISGVAAGSSRAVGALTTVAHGGTGRTIEERLSILEGEIEKVRHELEEQTRQSKTDVSRVRKELATETRERAAGDADVQKRIEDLAVGGLHLETIGLMWLMLATLATGIPQELARLLQ